MNRVLSRLTGFSLAVVLTGMAFAHDNVRKEPVTDRTIIFPDTTIYKTLTVDLHTHSVFSDGHVWPTIRVGEAVKDGLDALAITEHLEYQPHISDIPHPDRNRSFNEANRSAAGLDLTVIPGVEITRVGDPGHMNAVFVKDANTLVRQRPHQSLMPEHMFETAEEADAYAKSQTATIGGAHKVMVDGKEVWMPFDDQPTYLNLVSFAYASTLDPREVLERARDQGAFVFWNHPSFAKVDGEMDPFHKAATTDGLLHGIEIANGDHYYKNAHRLALKHDLALIGVSDVHGLIAWDYRPEAESNRGHRPVTLLLAEEDSLDSMREALLNKRTIVWWKHTLIGREKHLDSLLAAIITVESSEVTRFGLRVKLRNNSSSKMTLMHDDRMSPSLNATTVELAPLAVTELTYRNDNPGEVKQLVFTVLNALVEPDEAATIELRLD